MSWDIGCLLYFCLSPCQEFVANAQQASCCTGWLLHVCPSVHLRFSQDPFMILLSMHTTINTNCNIGCCLLTPFLAELGRRKAHLDQHFLQQPSAFVMPGLQPDRHIGGVQHGFIQAPVPHQGEAVVIDGAAVTATEVRRRWKD